MTVIADYVTVSTPIGTGPDLRDALLPVCLSLPESQTDPQGVRLGKFGLLRIVDQQRNKITVASCSGMMLAALRAHRLLEEYVSAVASVTTYNVTHLDLAHDQPGDPPSYVQSLYGRLRASGCALSRKRTPGTSITQLFSPSLDDGRDTGSVMIGHRETQRVSAIVYDRHHDALKKGKPDPGPIIRTEVRLGVPGMTLRDVLDPEPLFYRYASPDLVPRPDHVAEWSPYLDGGFQVPRSTHEPLDQLRRQVERSTDLQRMFRLVDQLPGEGIDALVRVLRSQYVTYRRTQLFAAGRDAPCDSAQTPDSHLDHAADLDG